MDSWDSIIHFEAEDGAIYFAPIPLATIPDIGLKVEAYSSIEGTKLIGSGKKAVVAQLLAPVPVTGIPIICIGLNYKSHAQESKASISDFPPMWYKPAAALANPHEAIPVSKQAYKSFLDFEGELTIITSTPAKDISPEEAPSYILGYTIGNDLTSRLYQLPKKGGGQFTYAKAFDKFAPLGPRLVSQKVFTEQIKGIATRVNGRTLQESPLDLIFPVNEIISFLSQGTTIPAGTAIMTGTPAGVGWFQNPQYSLKDGDVVEVEIQPIGVLRNKMAFV